MIVALTFVSYAFTRLGIEVGGSNGWEIAASSFALMGAIACAIGITAFVSGMSRDKKTAMFLSALGACILMGSAIAGLTASN
jgi:hypothetical protein